MLAKRPSVKVARRSDGGGVELRVTHARKMRRFGLGADMRCGAGQWNEKAQRFTAKMPGHAGLNATIGQVLVETAGIIDGLMMAGGFTWEKFDQSYRQAGQPVHVAEYLQGIADELDAVERHGNATLYSYAARVVARYTKGKPLPFADLTPTALQGMDRMLRAGGAQDGGVSQVFRTVRAAVNRAIKEGLMPAAAYPFRTNRQHGYDMATLAGKTPSRALSQDELARLKAFPVEQHPELAQSFHLFLFSYYARGMAFADMADLRREHLVGGHLVYRRRKTTRRSVKVIRMPLTGERAALLKKLDTGRAEVLPILGPEHRTEKQRRWRRIRCMKKMNADLKRIGELVGIPGLTSYVARHTFATQLRRQGVNVEVIGQILGHRNTATTELYLQQFEDPELDATDGLL